MRSFSSYLTEEKLGGEDQVLNVLSEAVSISDMQRVGRLISSYFSRKLRTDLMRLPGGEEYFNETGSGFGVRFFMKKPVNKFDSIRFNWRNKSINSAAVDSVDLFSKGKNVYNIAFDQNTSLVKILPFLFEFIKKPKKGYVTIMPEESLSEAGDDNPIMKINNYLVSNDVKQPLAKGTLYNMIKDNLRDVKPSTAIKLFDAIKKTNPQLIVGTGRSQKMKIGGGALAKIADDVFDEMFVRAKVTSGSSKETYKSTDPKAEQMDNMGLERLSFEQQVEDMKEAVRLLFRNVTNAVFIGGRGGIGKTHNVEDTLSELGLKDGAGYFKNAGSISAAGLYRTLFRNRNELILFDDSDNVFGDQEARNILKGATDTKPVRKIAWSKQSSDIVPADDFSDEDEEKGLFPSFFEFTGKIIFISNLDTDKLDPDGALRTRGILMEIDPSDQEVYDFMRKRVNDFDIAEGLTLTEEQRLEVVDVLEANPAKSPNFRTLVRALNMRAGASSGFDWKRYIQRYA